MTNEMKRQSRRQFLRNTAVFGTLAAAMPAPALLADKSPNSKLQIACIGIGGRGGANIGELVGETGNSEKLYAFCDVNANTLKAQSDKYQVEHRYADYRDLLSKHAKELDAVLVATLDHTHGIIACNAMNLALHCYCEKPLANSVWETRQMAKFAETKKLCTQTGTQVRSWNTAHYYRGIELLRAGAIGEVSEVHIWCQGTYVPKSDPVGETPVPPELNYDLWLGPAQFRPFNAAWLSFSKYGFWHSGSGWITGMGPHTIDLAWTALDLATPTKIDVDGPTPPSPLYNRDQQHVTFTVSPRSASKAAAKRPLKVHWYDGNRRPEGIAAELIDPSQQAGVLFVGKEGSLQVHYGYHTLFPKEKYKDFAPPAMTYPAKSAGHHKQWLDAIKAGKPEQCECRFEYAAQYMEAILIAANMHRSSVTSAAWNAGAMQTDNAAVNKLLKPEFRSGWDFPEVKTEGSPKSDASSKRNARRFRIGNR
ncbi:MAG: Gfo/Idh/MocA family oxidoreductase [Planctomycetaceae bacterium]|jgi:predicted dehydrogenase|nr:Gfo/Idh/MocA family oxidoreductase [Planctomycetaceae bacterium]